MNPLNKNQFLNDSNFFYWDEVVNNIGEVELRESEFENSYSDMENGIPVIAIAPESRNLQTSFDHELLHHYISSLGISPGGTLINLANCYSNLDKISNAFWGETGNLLGHTKMLPLFLEMGHNREDFIDDYHVSKADIGIINDLKAHARSANKLFGGRKLLPEPMMRALCAMKSCPNTKISYNLHYNTLRKAEPALFGIISTFWVQWNSIDIDEDFASVEARNVLHDLIERLDAYVGQPN